MLEMHMFVIFLLLIAASFAICPKGHFLLAGMDKCHLFLTCKDIKTVKLLEIVGYGTVKTVYKADWDGYIVALSELKDISLYEDFLHGWDMLQDLQGPYIVQPVGFCNEINIMVTEFHYMGHAVGVIEKLNNLGINMKSPVSRIQLCWNYAKILERLHSKNLVHCDSNSLMKTLSQLLITKDGTLVINDVDSLAKHENGVTCGVRPLYGDFIAPEQAGFPLPSYDEKVDIWKAASVCNYFVSELPDSSALSYRLHELHAKCRNTIAAERPNASELVAFYSDMLRLIHEDL